MISSAPPDIFVWTLKWARDRQTPLWAAEETESTNLIAKNEVAPLNVGARPRASQSDVTGPSLYLAKRQTKGRGRGSNTWLTADGALLSSWRMELKNHAQPILSPIIGLALYDAVGDTWPELDLNLKAPNDLFIGRKKTAGLLIENVDAGSEKHCVIGLGLNVLSRPKDILHSTCLAEHLKEELIEEKWRLFLDNWSIRLVPAVRAGLSGKLSDDIAERLTRALNRHPLLTEPILRVDEIGQLHSASRIVHWHEL